MSVEITARVWKHSQHSGSRLLLMLSLADYANNQGISWPGIESLTHNIRQKDKRNVRRLLRELEDSGEIITVPGGGYKNTNIYIVVLAMSDQDLIDTLTTRFYYSPDQAQDIVNNVINKIGGSTAPSLEIGGSRARALPRDKGALPRDKGALPREKGGSTAPRTTINHQLTSNNHQLINHHPPPPTPSSKNNGSGSVKLNGEEEEEDMHKYKDWPVTKIKNAGGIRTVIKNPDWFIAWWLYALATPEIKFPERFALSRIETDPDPVYLTLAGYGLLELIKYLDPYESMTLPRLSNAEMQALGKLKDTDAASKLNIYMAVKL